MVKASKARKVKWSVGKDEPDDLQDFKSNDEIGKPPRGVYRLKLKKLRLATNRNGDDMIKVTTEIAEGKKGKGKGKWDGYTFWDNLNVTDQGAPFVKRFLTSVGLTWKDFVTNTVIDETAGDGEKIQGDITKIGRIVFDKKEIFLTASTKEDTNNNGEDILDIARYLAPKDEDEADDDGDDDDEDEPEDDDDEDDSDDDAEEDDEDEDDEEDLEEELKAMTIAQLRKRALRTDSDAEVAGLKKAALIALVMELESGEDDDDDEPEDDEDDDDDESYEDELNALSDKALKERGRDRRIKGYKEMTRKKLIKALLADQDPPF